MIGTKHCTVCGEAKPFSDFYKCSRHKDGHTSACKKCFAGYNKKWYNENKEHCKKVRAEYYKNNIEKYKERGKEWRKSHPRENTDLTRAKRREWWANRTEEQKAKRKEKMREYQRKNKEKVAQWHKKYRESHKKQIQEASRIYRQNNKEKINQAHLDRLHSDPKYKLKEQTRNMLRYAMRSKGHRKKSSTKDIVGCDLDFLVEYLFKTWEKNYGKPWNGELYHIDHIIPLATAHTEEEVIKLCHYTNLQLLTPKDNMAKSDNLPAEAEA